MAQPPRNYPPVPPQPTFSPTLPSPFPNSPSPTGDSFPPPPKRQRLSPNATSPSRSPNFATMSLPNPGGHVNGTMTNGIHLVSHPAQPSSGLMPPPSRPPDRVRDKSDFTDVLTGTGVDLDSEETYMTTPYANQAAQDSSFDSQPSSLGTLSAGNSFRDGVHFRRPGSQETFYGAGPFNQPALLEKSPEDVEKERQELKDFQIARRRQHTMQAPFLDMNTVASKLEKTASENGISYNKASILRPSGPRQTFPLPPTEVVGPDETSIIVTRGETILQLENPSLADMMSLISLACEDRLRGFVDQSARLAEERREHSAGVVPLEWQNLAAVSRPADDVDGMSQGLPISSGTDRVNGITQSLPQGVANPNKIAEVLNSVSQQERAAEEARLAKRARRAAADSDGHRNSSVSTVGGASTPATMPSDTMADAADKRPTKKEQKKQAEAKASEAQMHKHANETARLAMGGSMAFGGKKKTYSWLNKGKVAPAATPGPTPTPASINTTLNKSATPDSADAARPATAGTATTTPRTVASHDKRFGKWKEESEKSPAIETRDVLLVLEADGRAPKALQLAYTEMSVKKKRHEST